MPSSRPRGTATRLGTSSSALRPRAPGQPRLERPHLDALYGWGQDPQPGQLLRMASMAGVAAPVSVRSAAAQPPGNYLAFYTQLRDHLWGLAEQPGVTPDQVHAVMQLLTLGAQSAAIGGFVALPSELH